MGHTVTHYCFHNVIFFPVEITFGPVAVGLAVVAFQSMLLGGLEKTRGGMERA